MHPEIAERLEELRAICARFSVRRLDLFGSAVGEDFDAATSDIDLLVELEPLPPVEYADAYFGLKESLDDLLGRPVDLVVESAVRNPYFRKSFEATRLPLYAA